MQPLGLPLDDYFTKHHPDHATIGRYLASAIDILTAVDGHLVFRDLKFSNLIIPVTCQEDGRVELADHAVVCDLTTMVLHGEMKDEMIM